MAKKFILISPFFTVEIAYVLLLRYESKLHSWKLVFFKNSCGKSLFVEYDHYLSFYFQDFSTSFMEKRSTNLTLKVSKFLSSWILTSGSTAEVTDWCLGWLIDSHKGDGKTISNSTKEGEFSEKPDISVFYLNL